MDTIPSWFCSNICPCCAKLRTVFGSQIRADPIDCLVTIAMLHWSNPWLAAWSAAAAGRKPAITIEIPTITRPRRRAILSATVVCDSCFVISDLRPGGSSCTPGAMGAKLPLNRKYHNASSLISSHFEDHPLKCSFQVVLQELPRAADVQSLVSLRQK